jgi:hypothetical protein
MNVSVRWLRMTRIEERLCIFVGKEKDAQRYQKLIDHLRKQGNEVMVVTLEDAECPQLITPHWTYVGEAEIDFWFRDILEGENKG